MAKRTYLELVNRILIYMQEDVVTTLDGASGKVLYVKELFNDAQKSIYGLTNWYTLFIKRSFRTSPSPTITIKDFTSTGDTFTIERDGDVKIFTEGVEWNNSVNNKTSAIAFGDAIQDFYDTLGEVVVVTVVNAIVTVRNKPEDDVGFTSLVLSNEVAYEGELANNPIYDVAEDFGRSIIITDKTNNWSLMPISEKDIARINPNELRGGSPRFYSSFGGFYNFYPIPSGTTTLVDRYYKVPKTLVNGEDVSDLPEELEPSMIKLVTSDAVFFKENTARAGILRTQYEKEVQELKLANDNIIDKIASYGGGLPAGEFTFFGGMMPDGFSRTTFSR